MKTELRAGVSLTTHYFDQTDVAAFGFNFWAGQQAAKSFFEITWEKLRIHAVVRATPTTDLQTSNKGKIWVWLRNLSVGGWEAGGVNAESLIFQKNGSIFSLLSFFLAS